MCLSWSDVEFSVWYFIRFSMYWQYFFYLNLALNLPPFCSLLRSFTALPPYFIVKGLLLVKHISPESLTNKAQFRKFCKRLSVYTLLIRFVQKQFCSRFNLPVLSFQIFLAETVNLRDIINICGTGPGAGDFQFVRYHKCLLELLKREITLRQKVYNWYIKNFSIQMVWRFISIEFMNYLVIL